MILARLAHLKKKISPRNKYDTRPRSVLVLKLILREIKTVNDFRTEEYLNWAYSNEFSPIIPRQSYKKVLIRATDYLKYRAMQIGLTP